MKTKALFHKCTTCNGTGLQECTPVLTQTIKSIPAKGKISVISAATKLGITEQTMNARLVTLLTLGIVTREKQGKKYLYSRTP